ncbi:ComEC/Rec2 family competence protein [Granulicatella sp. zg-84]|uniref:ComEC/Rec2 family competence protein n=1 Tax=Granulicatella sp. zg-84 TaxID=2678503 RepID=UPI0013C067B9|nr:ComEC/Rec2 family competence protein [Granulicatella sp. zg-84]NEW66304.1 DUF4131 domain-containing protein [Granulicatella sp. zg-84]
MQGKWIFLSLTAVITVVSFLYGGVFWFIFAIWWVRLLCFRHKQVLYLSFITVLIFAYISIHHQHKHSSLFANQTHYSVTLFANTVRVNGDTVTAKGVIQQEKIYLKIKAKTQKEAMFWLDLTDDIVIEATGTLETLPSARNPYQFDMAKYMKEQYSIFWSFNIKAYHLISRHFNIERFIQKQLEEYLPNPLRAFLNASLFKDVERDILEPFQESGMLFLVLLSGVHIQYILICLKKYLYKCGFTRETVQLLMMICSVFACLSQVTLGIKRAFLNEAITKSRLDTLSGFMLITIFINPYSVFTLAFQLGFGIPVLYQIYPHQKMLNFLFSIPFMSAHYFGVFLFPFLLPRKWFSITMLWIWLMSLIPVLLDPLNTCVSLLLACVQWISRQPFVFFVTGRLFDIQYVALGICLILYTKVKKKYLVYVLMICILFVQLPKEQVTVLDVGQGSSLLLQTDGQTVLIDTGGDVLFRPKQKWKEKKRQSLAQRTLIPTLKALGISKINTVFITHQDKDHCGALEELREKIPVEKIVFGKGATIRGTDSVVAPKTFDVGHATIQLLYPFEEGIGNNDHSLVFLMTFNKKKWLLMGDASQKVEHSLLSMYPYLQADILVVGHHGSKTSSSKAFIEHIRPSVSIISCGVNNRFGHPHQEVLDRLEKTLIYRTDKQGAIMYKEEKQGFEIMVHDTTE